ncbi:hypothetical protein ACRRTK_023241 [Alexandromys fortis]
MRAVFSRTLELEVQRELNKNCHPNFLIVEKDTTISEIEDAFRQFLNRDDIGTILINQYIAEMVQHALDAHQRSIPAVLEIPSKEQPETPSCAGPRAPQPPPPSHYQASPSLPSSI